MSEPFLSGKNADALIGKGTQVQFSESGFYAQATAITFSDRGAREAIDVTHMGSPEPGPGQWGGMEKIPSAPSDAGTIELTLIYHQGETPPWGGNPETIAIELPVKKGYATGVRYVGEDFLTGEGIEIPISEAVTQTATIQCTGVWSKIPAEKVQN